MFPLKPLHKLVFRSRRNGTTRWELPGDAVTQSINSIEDNPVNYTIFAASMYESLVDLLNLGSMREVLRNLSMGEKPIRRLTYRKQHSNDVGD